eukprot:2782057-Pleurochrysis_carterae.AAC.1
MALTCSAPISPALTRALLPCQSRRNGSNLLELSMGWRASLQGSTRAAHAWPLPLSLPSCLTRKLCAPLHSERVLYATAQRSSGAPSRP